MSEQPKTPDRSASYEAGVRDDLAEAEARIRGVVAWFEAFEGALRLLPRTRQSVAGWTKHLAEMAEQMNTELADVTEACTGTRNVITESVDVGLAENVVALRREA